MSLLEIESAWREGYREDARVAPRWFLAALDKRMHREEDENDTTWFAARGCIQVTYVYSPRRWQVALVLDRFEGEVTWNR